MFLIFAIIITLICVFWTWFQTNAASISGLATALAFFATAWAAHEGRKSARAAFRALKTSEDALEETRKNYLSDAFNQRFSLLLEQHNAYLEKVNNYVRTDSGWDFIKKAFDSCCYQEAFNAMSGHIILSPYMRILYHTLKFIDEDYYGLQNDVSGKKKYTSLIRSLISNDVLFLIAVNSSYVLKNGYYNQYYKYQNLLQQFDFFEHADFFCIYNQSDMNKKMEIEKPFCKVEFLAGSYFHKCTKEGDYDSISQLTLEFRTPVIIAYIYKNPLQPFVKQWFDTSPWTLLNLFTNHIDNRTYRDIFDNHFEENYINCYIDNAIPNYNSPFDAKGKKILTPEILKSIIRAVKNGRIEASSLVHFSIIRMRSNTDYVLLYNKFETLFYRIKDYQCAIDRKNDILFFNGFMAVKLMSRKLSTFEKEIRKQCAK